MRNNTYGKYAKVSTIISVLILLISLILTILRASVAGFTFCSHPVWLFLWTLAVGFGLKFLIEGIALGEAHLFMCSSALIVAALTYTFIDLVRLQWWLIVIIDVVVFAVFASSKTLRVGNRTEATAKNNDPEYKNYEQRRAEKEATEAEEEKNRKVPEIKSFKDETDGK